MTLPLTCPCPARGPVIAIRPGVDAFGAVVALDGTTIEVGSDAVADRVFCRACWAFYQEVKIA